MDDKLKEALEFSNYRLTLNNQKQNLIQRMNTQLTIGYANAMFTAKLELINFVQHLVDKEIEQFVFVDDNNNPVLVTSLKDFHSKLFSAYAEALNEFYNDYEKIKKQRTTRGLVGLNV
jgi:hypothetical protein